MVTHTISLTQIQTIPACSIFLGITPVSMHVCIGVDMVQYQPPLILLFDYQSPSDQTECMSVSDFQTQMLEYNQKTVLTTSSRF